MEKAGGTVVRWLWKAALYPGRVSKADRSSVCIGGGWARSEMTMKGTDMEVRIRVWDV